MGALYKHNLNNQEDYGPRVYTLIKLESLLTFKRAYIIKATFEVKSFTSPLTTRQFEVISMIIQKGLISKVFCC